MRIKSHVYHIDVYMLTGLLFSCVKGFSASCESISSLLEGLRNEDKGGTMTGEVNLKMKKDYRNSLLITFSLISSDLNVSSEIKSLYRRDPFS